VNDARVASAWAGLGATVVLVVGAVILGSTPKSNDAADTTLQFTSDHRGRLLVGVWVVGLGMVLSLVFVIGLSMAVSRVANGGRIWPTIVLAGGVATFTLGIAAFAFVSSAAYRSESLSADTARSMWDLYATMLNASNQMTILLSVAVGVMVLAGDALPRWIGWSSFIVAAAHLVATLSLARSGAFSPTGVFGQSAAFIFLVWMLATSITLLRRRSVAPV
jgi:hypothetical protein